MEALGLTQHSTTPTHKSNNAPNLIFTEIMSDIGVEVVETTSYIPDHCPVIAALNIKKEKSNKYKELFSKLLISVKMNGTVNLTNLILCGTTICTVLLINWTMS